VRRIDARTAVITTVAGGGGQCPGDGLAALDAILGFPRGLTLDAAGNLFIVDTGHDRVRAVRGPVR
jgi:hypothetical protein